eukprot:1086802-Ditylum_brightwellii.AAC.1
MQLASGIGIAFNKQCAKRSTCEQGADVGEMFKLIKVYAKKRNMLDLPPPHIYRHVNNLFDSLAQNQFIKLNTRKRKLLVDFITDLTQIYLLATSRKIVMSAFVLNIMTDDSDYLWPDINQMLNTLRYILSTEEYSLIFDKFNILYQSMRDNDTTRSEDVVPQRYGISQEWCQHCNTLSSPSQREMRKTHFSNIREKQQENENLERESIAKNIQLSNVVEEKIILKMKEIMNETNELGHTTAGSIDGSTST